MVGKQLNISFLSAHATQTLPFYFIVKETKKGQRYRTLHPPWNPNKERALARVLVRANTLLEHGYPLYYSGNQPHNLKNGIPRQNLPK